MCDFLPGNEHVFIEFAGPTPGSAVDMPSEALLQTEACSLEDLRIEVPAVVDDDQDRSPRTERLFPPGQDRSDAGDVRGERGCPGALLRRAELEAPKILEIEQLVRVAVLLVVAAPPRIGRRGDRRAEPPAQGPPARASVYAPARPPLRPEPQKRLDPPQRVQ